MPTSWASASWASSALVCALVLVLVGCGGGGPLIATAVESGAGMEDVPDRRTGGSADPVPTWRVTAERAISFSLLLRNASDGPVRVTGIRRDPNGDDQQFVPDELEPVTIPPGGSRRVTVRGRAICEERFGGQITGKNGQTFEFGDGETQNVDFAGLVEFDPCR